MPHVGYFPVTGYPKPLSIPSSAFNPQNDTDDYENELLSLRRRASLTGAFFWAPVHLPHNAVVNRMTLYGYRATAGSTLSARLYRSNRNGTQSPMATVTADWTGVWSSGFTETIDYPKIDNVNCTYAVRVNLDPDAAVSDCALAGIKIDWQ